MSPHGAGGLRDRRRAAIEYVTHSGKRASHSHGGLLASNAHQYNAFMYIYYIFFIFLFFLHPILLPCIYHTWVRLQQSQEQRYTVLEVHGGSFRVSVIHRRTLDMDYMIFNVRT